MLTMHSKPRSDQCLFFWALMRTGCARLSLFGISYVEGRGVLNLSFSRVGSGVGVVVVGEEALRGGEDIAVKTKLSSFSIPMCLLFLASYFLLFVHQLPLLSSSLSFLWPLSPFHPLRASILSPLISSIHSLILPLSPTCCFLSSFPAIKLAPSPPTTAPRRVRTVGLFPPFPPAFCRWEATSCATKPPVTAPNEPAAMARSEEESFEGKPKSRFRPCKRLRLLSTSPVELARLLIPGLSFCCEERCIERERSRSGASPVELARRATPGRSFRCRREELCLDLKPWVDRERRSVGWEEGSYSYGLSAPNAAAAAAAEG